MKRTFLNGAKRPQYVLAEVNQDRTHEIHPGGRIPKVFTLVIHDGKSTVEISRVCAQTRIGGEVSIAEQRQTFIEIRNACNELINAIDDWELCR